MSVAWLHVSDFHIGAPETDATVVLRALAEAVRGFRAQGRAPAVIVATGDIAESAQASEYARATDLLDDLVEAAGLTRRELFVVPGNHDVDRVLGVGLARTLESGDEAATYFRPGHPKPHVTQKLAPFAHWYDEYFVGIRSFPTDSTCGPVEVAPGGEGVRLGILPINTALFSQQTDDRENLLIGRASLDAALAEMAHLDVDLRVGILHHPLEWLSPIERAEIRARLHASIDVLLRGHLHGDEVGTIQTVDGTILYAAAGAAYLTKERPMRALLATLDGAWLKVLPIGYEEADGGTWAVDRTVFAHEPEFERPFLMPRLARAAATASHQPHKGSPVASAGRYLSNIPARHGVPFVGRDALLRRIDEGFQSGNRVALLQGPPGVGRSEAAFEYARRHRSEYPDGTFVLDGREGAVSIGLAELGSNWLDLEYPDRLPIAERATGTQIHLWSSRALVIFDDVASEETIRSLVPPAGLPCRILMTTLPELPAGEWTREPVQPLDDIEAIALIRAIGGDDVATRRGADLVAVAGGLPVQILPAANAIADAARHGRLADVPAAIASDAGTRFRELVLDRVLPDAKALLRAAAFLDGSHLRRPELLVQMTAAGWSSDTFDEAFAACLEIGALVGRDEPRIHPIVAGCVLEGAVGGSSTAADRGMLSRVRRAQRGRMIELSTALIENPTDVGQASLLLAYPADPQAWERAGAPVETRDGETVGAAFFEIGRFDAARLWLARSVEVKRKAKRNGQDLGESLHRLGETLDETGRFREARSWYGQAVEAKRLGDARKRVDHASLGESLHAVATCYTQAGDHAAARSWLEQAVEEKRIGDMRGDVDSESLGESLHLIGFCVLQAGDHAAARSWFEQAVKAKRKGDATGRIDHASLAKSLHQVGYCCSQGGDHAAARPWFEQAVEEARQGDLYGRIDHESLGASLRGIGYCRSAAGDYAAARAVHEQAVDAKRIGDIHGRVDHESLGASLHSVGYCFGMAGDFAAARPWYEQAVEEKRRGDIHGRVDHESIGGSLHQVGYCCSQAGDHAAARTWYEQAVEEARQGDTLGRVDHASLGASLHAVGTCHTKTGNHAVARTWYGQAVEAKRIGDVNGRVDHESVGKSLHVIGYSYSEAGDHAAARTWFEQAVEEKRLGDVHDRVDHASLGKSLHAVGYCDSQAGDHAAARRWYEEAVEEGRLGDVHGRVDHESLGASLHQVGNCQALAGDFAAAVPWLQQAVEAKQLGDVHGRVDHESLGKSLHLIGFCSLQAGDHAAALPLFEQAVREARQGDSQGRVDHESLGRSLHEVGSCYALAGDFTAARSWYEQAVEAKRLGDVFGRLDNASLRTSLHAVAQARAAPRRLRGARGT